MYTSKHDEYFCPPAVSTFSYEISNLSRTSYPIYDKSFPSSFPHLRIYGSKEEKAFAHMDNLNTQRRVSLSAEIENE